MFEQVLEEDKAAEAELERREVLARVGALLK